MGITAYELDLTLLEFSQMRTIFYQLKVCDLQHRPLVISNVGWHMVCTHCFIP